MLHFLSVRASKGEHQLSASANPAAQPHDSGLSVCNLQSCIITWQQSTQPVQTQTLFLGSKTMLVEHVFIFLPEKQKQKEKEKKKKRKRKRRIVQNLFQVCYTNNNNGFVV